MNKLKYITYCYSVILSYVIYCLYYIMSDNIKDLKIKIDEYRNKLKFYIK